MSTTTIPQKSPAVRVTRAWWRDWSRLVEHTKARMVAEGLVIFE